jgi:hypothetical protein
VDDSGGCAPERGFTIVPWSFLYPARWQANMLDMLGKKAIYTTPSIT